MPTLDLVVLVSGSGTNLQSILDAVAEDRLDARVKLVISNRSDAHALERAKRARVPTLCLPHREYSSREAYDQALVTAVQAASPSWVVLAGFLRVLTPIFIEAFRGRIINIHPSLLPAFPGLRAQKQALDYGVRISGCTVHLVDLEVDAGPIIGQRAVRVLPEDTEQTLSARILEQEHELLVSCLQALSRDELQLVAGHEGKRTRVLARLE